MATATLTRTKTRKAKKSTSCNRIIDLGNGVKFPVESEEEAGFVEWMIGEAKAGRASLPKRSPNEIHTPEWLGKEKPIKREDWWADYEYAHSDRF